MIAWIPGLPLLAFAVNILIGRRIGRLSAWGAVAALFGALALTCHIAPSVWHGEALRVSWPWLPGGPAGFWQMGLAVDGLSLLMLIVVTSIAPMIAVYSIGYMRHDPRFSRYFAYFSLFCASMLILVMADHFVLLYAGWELVGLCSYLLISFWFEKPAAAAAGRKAFITTRIGDTGLLLGVLWLAWTWGSLQFGTLAEAATKLPPHTLTAMSLLIFLGAVGKSAQVPLHVWLPDAMEGPTPVSALIHAATMVAAGVYLVARTLPLFTPQSLSIVLAIGLLTHLLAGTVALTQTDIKRILAYSTLSQLGLMMTALGLGAAAVAMFHLMTHAYFKALLFLAAGSVIHAAHTQELGELGGLRRAMPITAAVFFIGALSMSGVFPFSGFWSKDAVLLEARHAHPWLMWVLIASAVMTTGYVFRLYLRCFEGTIAHHGNHTAHESPGLMIIPLLVLACGALGAGLTGSAWFHPLFHLLGVEEAHEGIDPWLFVGSFLMAGAGIWLAWIVGVQRRNLLPEGLRPIGHRLYAWAFHKYYVDELYDRAIIQPFLSLAQGLATFDQRVIDGAVNGAGRLGDRISRWKDACDRLVVDRIVNGTASTIRAAGVALRALQTGIIQHYLFVVVVAVAALSFVLRR
ncbi:MAG: NADH-quinone oxidoreductase subunit L [Candidatus Omnitrophica bacterium]|nr:NADH-quinone oxidoreductase subunit L [Candidatus Omnitrophota bacterium]